MARRALPRRRERAKVEGGGAVRFRRFVGRDARRSQLVAARRPGREVSAMYRYARLRRSTQTVANGDAAVSVLLFRVCLVSLVLVWPPVSCQENSLTNRMRAISEDLDRQLNEIMASQALTYSTINIAGLPYNATTKFNPKGMGQLYNVTNMFIDLVQSKQAYPEGECFCEKTRTRRRAFRVRARKVNFRLDDGYAL